MIDYMQELIERVFLDVNCLSEHLKELLAGYGSLDIVSRSE